MTRRIKTEVDGDTTRYLFPDGLVKEEYKPTRGTLSRVIIFHNGDRTEIHTDGRVIDKRRGE